MASSKIRFDADTVALMARAFEATWHELQSRHLLSVEQHAARSAIACTIMAAVVEGERDQERLIAMALRSLSTAGRA